jgi:hypothetical protein
MSQLVQQYRTAHNEISTHHPVRLIWVSRRYGVIGNEIANELTREGYVQQFFCARANPGDLGPEHYTYHVMLWQGLISTQRQVHILITGPILSNNIRLFSFNRKQSR